jgi:hypothetical protein
MSEVAREQAHMQTIDGPRLFDTRLTVANYCKRFYVFTSNIITYLQHGGRSLWTFERYTKLPEALTGRPDTTAGSLSVAATLCTGEHKTCM